MVFDWCRPDWFSLCIVSVCKCLNVNGTNRNGMAVMITDADRWLVSATWEKKGSTDYTQVKWYRLMLLRNVAVESFFATVVSLTFLLLFCCLSYTNIHTYIHWLSRADGTYCWFASLPIWWCSLRNRVVMYCHGVIVSSIYQIVRFVSLFQIYIGYKWLSTKKNTLAYITFRLA